MDDLAEMDISDPVPTFSHLVSRIASLYPNLAYLHSTEPRVGTYSTVDGFQTLAPDVGSGNDFIRQLWGERPFLIDGGFKSDTALLNAEKHPWDVVAFGRMFLANVSSFYP